MGGVTVTPPILLLFYARKPDRGLWISNIRFVAGIRHKAETDIV